MYTRTAAMLGNDGVERLRSAKVIVFGVGGVGGYAVEALARAGVGEITIVDPDRVTPSNINRQIVALTSTVGEYKVDVMMQRIVDINPGAKVTAIKERYTNESGGVSSFGEFDYVLDCIDSVRDKLDLIESAKLAEMPVISAMGAGNKFDATAFTVSDISKTHGDPLSKVIRTELRKRGINHLKVVFSPEMPPEERRGERTPASLSYVPSVMGLIMAGEVIREIAEKNNI